MRIFDGLERCLSGRYDPDEQIFPEKPEEHVYREYFQFGWNFACRRGNNSGFIGALKDVNSDTLALVYAVFKEFIEDAGKDYIQEQLKNNGWSMEKVEKAREELEEKGYVLNFTELVSYPHVDVGPLLKQLLKDMRKKGLDVGYFKKIHRTHTNYMVTLAREGEFNGMVIHYRGNQESSQEIKRLQRTFQDLTKLCEEEGLEIKVTEDIKERSLSGINPKLLDMPLQRVVRMMM